MTPMSFLSNTGYVHIKTNIGEQVTLKKTILTKIRNLVGVNLVNTATDEIIEDFVDQATDQIFKFSKIKDRILGLCYYTAHLLELAGYVKDISSKNIADISESYSRGYQIRYLEEYKRLVRRKGGVIAIRCM